MHGLRALFLALLGTFAVTAGAHAEAFGAEPYQPDDFQVPVDHYAGWTDHADGSGPDVALRSAPRGQSLSPGAKAGAAAALVVTAWGAASALGLDPGALAHSVSVETIGALLAVPPAAVTALRQERAGKIDEARAILETAEKENRDLTADEQTRWDAAVAEADALEAKAVRQERQAELDATLEKRTEPKTVVPGDVEEETRSQPAAGDDVVPNWRRRSVRYFDALAMQKENEQRAASMMGELVRETRAMEARQVKDEEKEALQIVERSGLPPQRQKFLRHILGLGEYRLLSTEDGGATGGDLLLPKPFLAEIFVLTEEYGVARRLFRTIPFTGAGNKIDLKNVVGRVIAYWVDEGELIPPSDMQFGDDFLKLGKLAGITTWTSEAEEDTAFALLPILQDDFAESISFKEDSAGILGTGTAEFGGYTGVFNLPGATVIRTGSETGGVTEGVLRRAKSSVSQSRRRNASWLMHETVMDEIRQLENTAGYRLFSENLTQGGATNLLGYPVEFAEVAPAASGLAANKPVLSFGDHRRVLMGIKGGLMADVDRTAIVQNTQTGDILVNAFQSDSAVLRVKERVGFATPTTVQGAISVVKTKEAA